MNKYGIDLDRAWARLLRQAPRFQIPDILAWEDHKLRWQDWKTDIERRLDADDYRPIPPVTVEWPKDMFAVRPMALLHPTDLVVYEAVVDSLAPTIDSILPDEVLSSRLQTSSQETQGPLNAWLRFQDRAKDLYQIESFEFMLSTDVVSYYEYVDLNILSSDLKSLPGIDAEVVDFLHGLLKAFQQSHVWGLPQGIRASAILANLYLLPLDRSITHEQGVKYVRYQDDIRVFSNERSALRLALQKMNRALRGRHLSLSVHKTKLLEGTQILEEVEDARKDAIQYGMRVSSPAVTDQLRDMFDRATAAKPPLARDIRFATYRLGLLADPHAVPWVLDNLSDVPYLMSYLVDYLSEHVGSNPEIEERVRDYLGDDSENLYPWAELQLLRMLARAGSIAEPTYACVWGILMDDRKESLVRQYAARCVGQHARPGDMALLRDALAGTSDFWIRRALLVAIAEAQRKAGQVDRAWFEALKEGDRELGPTAKYLLSSTRIPGS